MVYVIQIGTLGNFGMGDLYAVEADDELDALDAATSADDGRNALDGTMLDELQSEDPDAVWFSPYGAPYDANDFTFHTSIPAPTIPQGDTVRHGMNYGDSVEWD